MLTAVYALLLASGPLLTTSNDVELHIKGGGARAILKGTIERVKMVRGGKEWLGTALVLDDGTPVWLTYNAPPKEWEPVLGKFVTVEAALSLQSSFTVQSLRAPHLVNPSAPRVVSRSLADLKDRIVRLVGTAEDSKGGAAVLVEGGTVFVAHKDHGWPDQLRGRRMLYNATEPTAF